MNGEYDTEIESIIQQAQSLQESSLPLENIKESTGGLYGKITALIAKFLNLVSEEFRYNTLRYYRLWMLYVISWLGNVFLYVQLAEIISKKDSTSVSAAAFSVLLISSFSWFTYGFLLRDPPLLISGMLQMTGVILLLIFIPKYKKPASVKNEK